MPPKKKGKSIPALTNKEIAHITRNLVEFVQSAGLKKDYWATLGESKHEAANRLFNGLKQERKQEVDSAIASAIPTSTVARDSSNYATSDAGGTALRGFEGETTVIASLSEATSRLTLSSSNSVLAPAPGRSSFPTDVRTPSETTSIRKEKLIDEPVILDMPERREFSSAKQFSAGSFNRFQPAVDLSKRLKNIDVQTATYPIRQEVRESTSEVLTNYCEITIAPGTELFEYQIVGIPEKITKRERKPIIKTIIERVPFLRNNEVYFATDYNEKIIAWKDLNKIAPANPVSAGARDTQEGREWRLLDIEYGYNILQISLRYTRSVDYYSLQRYVNSDPNLSGWDSSTVVDALNIMISKCFDGQIIKLGANRFFVEGTQRLLGTGGTMCTLRGYEYSIRPKMGKILLNICATTSAFYMPKLVSEYLQDDWTFSWDDRLRFLKGVRVYIDYERGNRDKESRISGCNRPQARVKKVFEVGNLSALQQKFKATYDRPDGTTFTRGDTVAQYLNTRYGITLQQPNLNVINLGSKSDESWFAPECLRILPYQIFRHVVPDNLMSNMHTVACHKPEKNQTLIKQEGIAKLLRDDQIPAKLTNCPVLRFKPQLLQIPCHRLPNPVVYYANNGTAEADGSNGRWNLARKKFLQNGGNTDFPYAFLVPSGLAAADDTLREYDKEFRNQLLRCGVGRPIRSGPIELQDLSELGLRKALETTSKRFPRPKVSICVTEKCLSKKAQGETPEYLGLLQYMGNVMMKANLKRGGVNHASKLVQKISTNTLVLGADVTHPSPGALPGSPSIAAVVGSIDGTGGKFIGELSLQENDRQEMIGKLGDMVLKRLKSWYSTNNRAPDNILYYRDGVSDTQYSQVEEKELGQIHEVWNEFLDWIHTQNPQLDGTALKPLALTAVIVTKRHKTHFYPLNGEDKMPGNQNCKPGTLVDSAVTSPYFRDFFLQSHNSILGTAKPAHYFVLENGVGWSDEEIQDITHHFCHSYVRAILGVSYASPAYYADRLCERGRAYLREYFSPSGPDRAWFDYEKQQLEKARGMDNQPLTPPFQDKEREKTQPERDTEK